MIRITDKKKCCGCTACYFICPNSAIKMQEDSEGFLYPNVNDDKCINCGLCLSVCRFKDRKANDFLTPKSYAVQHLSNDILAESTSGGAFTALSDYVLNINGVVYGAAFDSEFKVVHLRAENVVERDKMRGSKYVQSYLDETFKKVKEDLENNLLVLFTGTPCQVDGLKSFLIKDYDNLLCCDLICHGAPSPKVWQAYVKYLEKLNNSKLVSYKFRPKRWGWYVHSELSEFENGKIYHSNANANLFRDMYYGRLIMRPSCHNCKYTNLDRPSDITIADCRGIDNVIQNFGAYDGASLVIVNTKKGQRFFDSIQDDIKSVEVDINKLLQPPLKTPSLPSNKREQFFDIFNTCGLKKAILSVWGKTYFVKQFIKKLLKKYQ